MFRTAGTTLIVTALLVSVGQVIAFANAGSLPAVDLRTMVGPLFGADGILPWRELVGFIGPVNGSFDRLLGAPLAACCLVAGAAMIALTDPD